MVFKRREAQKKSYSHPGEAYALEGLKAAHAAESSSCDVVVTLSSAELEDIASGRLDPELEKAEALAPRARQRRLEDLASLPGLVTGYAASGLRVAGFTSEVRRLHESLAAASGKGLPFVLHLACKAVARQAGALHGGHDPYYAVAGAGFFQLFAKNPQEAADFALISHRIAELSLTPGICAQDLYQTSHSVARVYLGGAELSRAYLGESSDEIESPSPAQTHLFGERRRRIPRILDDDHAAGVGGAQGRESHFRALAAREAYLAPALGSAVSRALIEFEELTGRSYRSAQSYRAEDADYVVIAQGSVVERLEHVVDDLRRRKHARIGVIDLKLFRPFPGPELTRLLRGKKAVTVLERTVQPGSEDAPIARELRSAIDRALENGTAAEGEPPFPEYESYRKPAEKPRILSGSYGVGGELPSNADLVALFRNMSDTRGRRKSFYLGVRAGEIERAYPHLESLEQQLRREYPRAGEILLGGEEDVPAASESLRSMSIRSLSFQGGLFAANLFAQALARTQSWAVRTFPEGGLERNLQPVSHLVLVDPEGSIPVTVPSRLDAVLVSGHRLVETLPRRTSLREGAALFVATSQSGGDLWKALSRRSRRWISTSKLRVFALDAQRIAEESSSRPGFVDQLAIWALIGSYLRHGLEVSAQDAARVKEDLAGRLARHYGSKHSLISDVKNSFEKGYEEGCEVDWRALEESPVDTEEETEAPWTVPREGTGGDTVFDPARFWRSVGYLYESGQSESTILDPYLASGILPAASSAYRDMRPYRMQLPHWLPDRCTGCGLCWALCPDSALPATVQRLTDLVDTAIAACKQAGHGMVQLQRLGRHLADSAYRLVLRDDPQQLLSMGPLMTTAFEKLLEKLGLDEEGTREVREEFDLFLPHVDTLPFARTEAFFSSPHASEKGSGHLLSIALNPIACKGCGLCLEACPEDAFDWESRRPIPFEEMERNREFTLRLPDPSSQKIAALIDEADPLTQSARMLDKTAYHSLVGGDGGTPGNGIKAAVHLIAAAAESVMRPRFEAHVERLTQLVEKLEEKIQGKVSSAMKINDFETFSRKLSQYGRTRLTPEDLAKIAGDSTADLEPDRLERMARLQGGLSEILARYREGNAGSGRARVVFTVEPGLVKSWMGTYPDNPLSLPWISHQEGDAVPLARGVWEGLALKVAEEMRLCRMAELEIADSFSPGDSLQVAGSLDWSELTDAEKQMVPAVMALLTRDTASWEEIAPVLTGSIPVRICVLDPEAVALEEAPGDDDPGRKGGGAEAPRASGLGLLAAAQGKAFVLQSTFGTPGHLLGGVAEGMESDGPALYHVHAPEPFALGIAPEKTAEVAELAAHCRCFPLFKATPAARGSEIVLAGNPDPERDWCSRSVEYRATSGAQKNFDVSVTVAEWAVLQARFSRHFRSLSPAERAEHMVSLAEYLERDDQDSLEPVVEGSDPNGRRFLATVSADLVAVAQSHRRDWRQLKRLAEGGTWTRSETGEEAGLEAPQPAPQPGGPPAPDPTEREKLTERLLWLSGFTRDPDFFRQSLREFVSRDDEARSGDETDGA